MSHDHNRFLVICKTAVFRAVVMVCGVCGGISLALSEVPFNLSEEIAILAQYKSNAEQQAAILVGLKAEEDITKNNYRKGQSLYAEAKAGFDGWIDQLIFEVRSGQTETLSPQFETIQEAAKVKGDDFTKFVQEQFLGNPRGEIGELYRSLFAEIGKVGRLVIQGLRQSSGPDQSKMIKQLEGYKWSPFPQIEQRLASDGV